VRELAVEPAEFGANRVGEQERALLGARSVRRQLDHDGQAPFLVLVRHHREHELAGDPAADVGRSSATVTFSG
jgi:hypothetical protein